MSRRILAVFAAGGLFIGAGLWGLTHHQATYCDYSEKTQNENCATHSVLKVALLYIDHYSAAIQAVAGFASALFACVLLFVSNRQAKLIEEANKTAEKSAKAAEAAANAAIEDLKQARLSNRPLIIFAGTYQTSKSENPTDSIEVMIAFKNAGQRPAAIKSEWWCYGEFEQPPIPNESSTVAIRMYPAGGIVAVTEVWPDPAPKPSYRSTVITDEQRSRAKDKTASIGLYVYGSVVYSDGFGDQCETVFCRRYDGYGFTLDWPQHTEFIDSKYNRMT